MKRIILICCTCFSILRIEAQETKTIKTTSIAFHIFYNDFKTAQQIKLTSLSDVLKNDKWSGFREMQAGFGLNYLKGLNQLLDFTATLDGSSMDYLFKDGSTNGVSKFLLDMNVGFNAKLLNDANGIIPYFFGGAGFTYYKKSGLYFPAGVGLKFNLFNEGFILTNMQYRFAGGANVNNHLYYTIGIGTSISKKQRTKPVLVEPIVVTPVQPPIIKIAHKDIRISVVDEQTGEPLPAVNIAFNANGNELKGVSNSTGEVFFPAVKADNYSITGVLNDISTTSRQIQKSSFDGEEKEILIKLTHNDPRFTLTGIVEDKNAHTPMGGGVISIIDKTLNKTITVESNSTDGKFNIQLSENSDYILSAKKSNYISNIEVVSTKGLNRSTTLYVKLLLGIEETKPNSTINLKNIYYATGSSSIKQEASSDLDRLVLFLTDNPSVKIEIDSHTDSRGSASSNLSLSKKRAQEVVNYLKRKNISETRLVAKGYGETKLINDCKDGVKCSEAQHEQNRRTEFKVLN
ncbi:OmpA family protein [Pedobacter sp. Du54]|uniref:OmpA family protein n=1 Tax=Pedobacter anseongensis TaxID=3133439 RepID=UPI00309C9D44